MNDSDRLAEVKARRAALDGHTCLDLDWLPSIDWLVGEVDRLRDLLARLEWAVNCYDDPRCPSCGAYKHGQPPGQHDPGCELAAALAGNDEASRPTP